MTRRRTQTRGATLAARLARGQQRAERAMRPGARELPILRGVTTSGTFTSPMENVLEAACRILVESGSIYRYGSSIVLAQGQGEHGSLRPLRSDRVEPAAPSLLANTFICEIPSGSPEESPLQFAPPRGLVDVLLNRGPTLAALPEIVLYARRPIFDADFNFRGPGWHAEIGVLVHGPRFEPAPLQLAAEGESGARVRLPHLSQLLSEFCFKSETDRANAVAALLTPLLFSHFVDHPKPVVLVDGNQPNLGKSLLALLVGIIHDGVPPEVNAYTPDDSELAKKLCATLRNSNSSVLLIDNAKAGIGQTVNSTVIESQSMAPTISMRILGQSDNLRRPNDVLWMLTMNATKTSPDLASRAMPIRLHYEGNPRRNFRQDPQEYARTHRIELLAELAGMVEFWTRQGRPAGQRRQQPHRCDHWDRLLGGIMTACGFPEFLSNLDEAARDFDSGSEELAALAEAAVRQRHPIIFLPC